MKATASSIARPIDAVETDRALSTIPLFGYDYRCTLCCRRTHHTLEQHMALASGIPVPRG
jgi:predicted restriction endonuclease